MFFLLDWYMPFNWLHTNSEIMSFVYSAPTGRQVLLENGFSSSCFKYFAPNFCVWNICHPVTFAQWLWFQPFPNVCWSPSWSWMLFLSDLDSLARPSLIEYVSIEVLKGFFFWPSFGGSYWERFKKFVNKQEELLGVQGILSEWKTKVLVFCLEDLLSHHLTCLFSIFCFCSLSLQFLSLVGKKLYVSSVFFELNSSNGAIYWSIVLHLLYSSSEIIAPP